MSEEGTEVVTTLDIGNMTHFRILTMINLGLVPEEIAATIKCSTKLARRIAADPETPKHIETVKKLGRCMNELHRGSFDQLQSLAIEAMFEVFTSENSSHDQKLRAALAVFDRHPDGEFVKTAKSINKEEVEVGFSNDTMRTLKKIADKTNPLFIDVTPHHEPAPHTGRSPQPDPASHQGPACFLEDLQEAVCDAS